MFRALGAHTPASATFVEARAEDFMPRLKPRSVDLIFSSPPYFNLEHYSSADSQSYRRYPSYASWRDGFLEPVLVASYRALRPGGHLVINVANAGVHAIARDLEATGRALFHHAHRLRLLMHSRPLQRAARMEAYRWEPVFVFRKTC
jgi:DNA modification methylase